MNHATKNIFFVAFVTILDSVGMTFGMVVIIAGSAGMVFGRVSMILEELA
jgi:hypothetical protein